MHLRVRLRLGHEDGLLQMPFIMDIRLHARFLQARLQMLRLGRAR